MGTPEWKGWEQKSSKGHKKGMGRGEFPRQRTLSFFQPTELASSFSLPSGAAGECDWRKCGLYIPAVSVGPALVPHSICMVINKRDVLLRDCHGNIFGLPGMQDPNKSIRLNISGH